MEIEIKTGAILASILKQTTTNLKTVFYGGLRNDIEYNADLIFKSIIDSDIKDFDSAKQVVLQCQFDEIRKTINIAHSALNKLEEFYNDNKTI